MSEHGCLSGRIAGLVRALELCHRDLRPYLTDVARMAQRLCPAHLGLREVGQRIVEGARVLAESRRRMQSVIAQDADSLQQDGLQQATIELIRAALTHPAPANPDHSRAGLVAARGYDRARRLARRGRRASLAEPAAGDDPVRRFRGWPGVNGGAKLGLGTQGDQAPVERVAAPDGQTLATHHPYLPAALNGLPDRQAWAIRQRAMGHSVAEIALAAGVSGATVRQWLSRGTRTLLAERERHAA